MVPTADFRMRVAAFHHDYGSAITELSATYRVSDEVVVRKMLDLGLVSQDFYERKRHEFADRKRPPATDREIKIPRSVLTISSVGRSFAKAAVTAFHENEISGVQLASLLDMRLHHLPQLEAVLFPSKISPLERDVS